MHTKDGARTVLSCPDDERFIFLLSLADMFEKMSRKRQGVRVKQLNKDTSYAFSHTSRGMFDLKKHLLNNGFSYVCLRHFSTKLRQGSGGTCFINVQQVLQKVTIHKTKLFLDLSVSFDEQSLSSDHSCEKCSYFVNREAPVDGFQNLPELEQS